MPTLTIEYQDEAERPPSLPPTRCDRGRCEEDSTDEDPNGAHGQRRGAIRPERLCGSRRAEEHGGPDQGEVGERGAVSDVPPDHPR